MNLSFKQYLIICENQKFVKKTLKQGQKVEFEHTKNPKIALKIAKDHIKEFPIKKNGKMDSKYYKELDKMEKKLKESKNQEFKQIFRRSDLLNIAHRHFDKIWKVYNFTRSQAYEELAKYLNIPVNQTHFGLLSNDQLFNSIKFSKNFIKGKQSRQSVEASQKRFSKANESMNIKRLFNIHVIYKSDGNDKIKTKIKAFSENQAKAYFLQLYPEYKNDKLFEVYAEIDMPTVRLPYMD